MIGVAASQFTSPTDAAVRHGPFPHEQSLAGKVAFIAEWENLTDVEGVGKILRLDHLDKPAAWNESAPTGGSGATYRLVWPDWRADSGIRTIRFRYIDGTKFSPDRFAELYLDLTGKRCVTFSMIQKATNAQVGYWSAPAIPERWLPNPPSSVTDKVEFLRLTNNYGLIVIIDSGRDHTMTDCLPLIRFASSGSRIALVAPP